MFENLYPRFPLTSVFVCLVTEENRVGRDDEVLRIYLPMKVLEVYPKKLAFFSPEHFGRMHFWTEHILPPAKIQVAFIRSIHSSSRYGRLCCGRRTAQWYEHSAISSRNEPGIDFGSMQFVLCVVLN